MTAPGDRERPRWRQRMEAAAAQAEMELAALREADGERAADTEPAAPPPVDADSTAARLTEILNAAERAAEDIRAEAERKAAQRIAEAERAARMRVEAAETEAREVLDEAQRRAATLSETATADAQRARESAEAAARRILEEARQQAAENQRIAEVFAKETREKAQEEVRAQLRDARQAAGAVLAEGTELTDNVRALARSLHANADVLLRDIAEAHAAMVAALDRLDPERRTRGADVRALPAARAADVPADFGDVPEFIPRTPRRRAG